MDRDRRTGKDRRAQTGLSLRMLTGNGSRRIIRRKADSASVFLVDQYSPILFLTIISILFLCCMDALLTLFLLERGAYETNLLMAYLISFAPLAFFIPKYILTVCGTLCLFVFRVMVIRKWNITTHSLLHFIAWLYVGIVAWELYLIYFVV
jgi:hypothetical protein